MTRQMADDEVLRVLDEDVAGCGMLTPEDCVNCARLRSVRDYVAALQAERDALRAEEESSAALIQRQSDLLTGAVNVLRGDPPPLTLWSHHDVAELARAMKDRAERAESALEALRGQVEGLVDDFGFHARGSGHFVGARESFAYCTEKLAELLAIKERMG